MRLDRVSRTVRLYCMEPKELPAMLSFSCDLPTLDNRQSSACPFTAERPVNIEGRGPTLPDAVREASFELHADVHAILEFL